VNCGYTWVLYKQRCIVAGKKQNNLLTACTGCRQKLDDGQTQPTPAGQQLRTYTDKAGSGDDDFKPTLLSDDARYLRKRKLHMDSMLESAADS